MKRSRPNGRVAVRLGLRDYNDPSINTEFSFETVYSELAKFKIEVEHLMARNSQRAILLGD